MFSDFGCFKRLERVFFLSCFGRHCAVVANGSELGVSGGLLVVRFALCRAL